MMIFDTKRFFSVILLFIFSQTALAQLKIEGKVVEENDKAVPYASIKLANENEGIVTDSSGNFIFRIPAHKKNDTILISSVGYEPLKIPVAGVTKKARYILKSYSKKLETVVVRSFSKEDVAGAKSDNVGYFRSWNPDHTGGEIGRTLYMPHKEYLVSRVRFKIFSTCDTCIIKLHIREMSGGIPGRELLKQPVMQTFYHASSADKTYDIDLVKYNLVLQKESIFVSFEVLKGSSGTERCSMSFVGSEPGVYMYKSSESGEWRSTEDYAIHMKVFFRYDD